MTLYDFWPGILDNCHTYESGPGFWKWKKKAYSKKSSRRLFQNTVLNFFLQVFLMILLKTIKFIGTYCSWMRTRISTRYPVRPNARGLDQHGGPPGRLEESDPAGCDLNVMDGPPPALIACPGWSITKCTLNTVMSYVTQRSTYIQVIGFMNPYTNMDVCSCIWNIHSLL